MTHTPLSIIVPVLNEAKQLPGLCDSLGRQQGVVFDVTLCDGGSRDATHEVAKQLAASLPFPVTLIDAARGRGSQMNAGARFVRGEWLLFLHVDSRFEDPHALILALAAMQREHQLNAGKAAGHFPLRFARTNDMRPRPGSTWRGACMATRGC